MIGDSVSEIPGSVTVPGRASIALGPDVCRPSWEWVGFDLSRELSKYYSIHVFSRKTEVVPPCDVVLMIKQKPGLKFLKNFRQGSAKLLFCPVDKYDLIEQIEADVDFLGKCHGILVHCERLVSVFRRYCPRVEFVEHHNRFGFIRSREYSINGYAVWVGEYQHLPRVVEWLQRHPLGMEIKFVTNYSKAWKKRLRDALPIQDPHEMICWSPNSQREVMEGAKAAFDIKGTDFNQTHKPPVKAQQFICSGIPFAVNPESSSYDYFAARGFRLASPLDPVYWLSQGYWENTQRIGRELSAQLTLENVGAHYKRIIDKTISKT